MIKSILLDFDGVISDSLSQIINSWQENTNVYGSGIQLTKDFVKGHHTGSWKIFYQEVLGIPENKLDEASKLFLELADKHGVNPIFNEMEDVIKELSKNYDLYVLSSNFESSINRDLAHYGLKDYFKGVSGHENSRGLDKSNKDFILNFLKDWKLDPNEVIYAGDTTSEVNCGIAAGIKTIGCTWGFQTQKQIEEVKPTAIAFEPKDLISIISHVAGSRSAGN